MNETSTTAEPSLISVQVGLPADVAWRGRTVHTGIYKNPVRGPVMVRRLNIDGDGQGDLGGHGGEQRAVMVYQQESYDHWARHFGRGDLRPGMFGENFTITGLSDDEVCIGDRYRIGEAEFEVTQPRVTCFRVGMRLGEPDMPKLLVAHRRPGFYFRVIREGRVAAGDAIVRTRRGRHELSVAAVDALLYLPDRDVDLLRKAVGVAALSPGWQQSFAELLAAHEGASPTTAPATGLKPGWSGFRDLRVARTRSESPTVLSIELESVDGSPLPVPLPGQYLTVKVPAAKPALLRSYSLSGFDAPSRYRLSVKRDDHGTVSRWLHSHVEPGVVLQAAAPRGDFYLTDESAPVVLMSAGIGVTPLLAMLHALAAGRSDRELWWVHVTRDPDSLAFAAEVDELMTRLPRARQQVYYVSDTGRPDQAAISALHLPADAVAYLCGPQPFMADMRAALSAAGIDPHRIHSELFGSLPPVHPGIVGEATRAPHPPDGGGGDGPAVSFSRSGITVNWSQAYDSLLELAEACDVPTRFSCRSGVCHVCVTPLVDGMVDYSNAPLEPPPDGSVLICSATPRDPVVLDL